MLLQLVPLQCGELNAAICAIFLSLFTKVAVDVSSSSSCVTLLSNALEMADNLRNVQLQLTSHPAL